MPYFGKDYFPSAEEMKVKASQSIGEKDKEELRQIFREIEATAAHGKRSLYRDGELPQAARSKLKELGYEIEAGSQYNESFYYIRW